ncbi:hypothetical protein J6590_098875 [Homalodisca vitripennis]|nr:hypothetical protein J6590_098875 [Homalodisca vitripennis]
MLLAAATTSLSSHSTCALTSDCHDRLEEKKKLRQGTQAIFEEQDLELCQLINNQSKTMDEQKNIILTLQKKIIIQGAINKTYQNSYTQTNNPVSDNTKYSVSSAPLLIDLEEIKTKLNQMEAMLRFLKTDLNQENKSSTAMQNSQSLKKIRCTDRKTIVYSVSLQAAKYAQVYQKEVTRTPEILFMNPTTTSAEETDSETHIPTADETPVITAAEKTMNITTNSSEKTSVKTTWNTLTETNMATAAEKITTAGSKTSPTTAAEKRMSTVAETNLNCSSPFQPSQVSPSGGKNHPIHPKN